ncbi:MAG TPA: glycosyltransferase, partial [Segetibacter sp.]|nr:glycosyltransferase [Segetibacter sp.]
MLHPIKVVDIELSRPISTISGLTGYLGLLGLVRLHGAPIGYINVPVTAGEVCAQVLSKSILESHDKEIINTLLYNGLTSTIKPNEFSLEALFSVKPSRPTEELPLVTVAVCTRNRTEDLSECLNALSQLDYPLIELLVIDNAPSSDSTEQLIKANYPNVRYILEPRPGLDWARNRAAMEATGEIVAYTDDDVIVDAGWVTALARVFSENREVMALTGLVVPYELETRAQVLFEMNGGFGRGFERKWHKINGGHMPWGLLGTGQFGTGANMAFRRSLFNKAGLFDPALDVGTITNGGGDLEMFFRVLKEGHMLVYEPSAIVRHRHRPQYDKLEYQLKNNSKGLLAYCVRSMGAYPEEKKSFFKLLSWWYRHWHLKRLFINYIRPSSYPNHLLLAEFRESLKGFKLYHTARKNAIEVAKKYGSASDVDVDRAKFKVDEEDAAVQVRKPGTAIRTIDISNDGNLMVDLSGYKSAKIYVKWRQFFIGFLDIENNYKPLSSSRIAEEIVKQLDLKLLEPTSELPKKLKLAKAVAALQHHYFSTQESCTRQLSPSTAVSIVIATYDRPDDLRRCLASLATQKSTREIEVIVVDNNPSSGLTAPAVGEFEDVVLVNETRKGLSYARNAGINASKGEIIISTDDDVIVPSDWVENLVSPFVRADVMAVTGNVLPLELETTSQHFFEIYGGLGRGFKTAEFDGKWFQSFRKGAVPTWKIGACANAAFRAKIFANPEIGM